MKLMPSTMLYINANLASSGFSLPAPRSIPEPRLRHTTA